MDKTQEIFDVLHQTRRHARAMNNQALNDIAISAERVALKEILDIDLCEGSDDYDAVMREVFPHLFENCA